MRKSFNIIRAFLIRDATIALSYRLNFLLKVASLLFSLAGLYFVSEMVGDSKAVESYGGYLPFAVIGLGMGTFCLTGFQSFSKAIRREQMMGTLEAMLVTPAKLPVIVVGSSVWSFFWATLTAIIYPLGASLMTDFKLQGNLALALVMLILTTVVFSSLGVISASFIMVFKQGDPLGFLVGAVSGLFGGMVFPVESLPVALRWISYLLPITHGLDGLREILLKGGNLQDVWFDMVVLLGFAVVLVPLSLYCFSLAVRYARREGSLLKY